MLPLRARVDLGTMAMKGYSTFPKAPALLESHHQIVLNDFQNTHWGSLTPLQSVYSTAPANWARNYRYVCICRSFWYCGVVCSVLQLEIQMGKRTGLASSIYEKRKIHLGPSSFISDGVMNKFYYFVGKGGNPANIFSLCLVITFSRFYRVS